MSTPTSKELAQKLQDCLEAARGFGNSTFAPVPIPTIERLIEMLTPSIETRAGACVGKWHIPTLTCSACGASLEQCPECRVIAGHMNDCSGNTQTAKADP